ncbi:Glyoxylase, beta-lactamase superfamily II [Alteromonadaceae bacterium Bs31]|nr:Glyoxylase, beta-lactamase superfamily II [Alteromonadaceae bacterium Bs31]
MKKLLIALVTTALTAAMAHSTLAAEGSGLQLDVYNAESGSFGVNATLVYGETEALLVDTGFTKADALRIAAKILDSKRTLKTIFISQADPDYYFGAEVIHSLFPDAKIITSPAVKAVIEKKLAAKLAFWGPKMGANAPVTPIIPEAYKQASLTIDGHTIEIKGGHGVLAHRPYLWIPEKKVILGNVAIFGNMHLWMADAQSQEAQTQWKKQLKLMLALEPLTVIPGHMTPTTELNSEAIHFTLQYINDFQEEKKNSKNSEELIKAMAAKYPDAQGTLNLTIAAKVHTGEMKW